MASNIPGVTDYISQIQPFQVDLNFYSGVLQTKQSQYDAGYKQLSGLYSSILNSPMIRDDNNNRRDEFLKAIDQDVKKISGLDLSKQENIMAANTIFKPFYEDKNIIHDMAFTKKYQRELGKAEALRNCPDPDKCGGAYWEKGVIAMSFQAEEYKNAAPEEALKYSAPKFTPYINVTKKAIDAAKSLGFKVEIDQKSKGYIVTDTNGKLLLGDDNNGPLPQFLYGMFGQDQSVLDMFNTEAYVQRKSYAKSHANEFGSEDNAEMYYLNNIIKSSVPVLEKNASKAKAMIDELGLKKKILEEKGAPISGSDEESALQLINALYENAGPVKEYHDNVLSQIQTAANLNDLKALRGRADNLIANELFQRTLNNAAEAYAMGTAKREMKADPYDLERFKTSQDIYKHQKNAMFDLQTYIKKMEYAKQEGIGPYAPKTGKAGKGYDVNELLRAEGLNPNTATPEQINQVIEKAAAGKPSTPFVAQGGVKQETGYEQNVKLFLQTIPKLNKDRTNHLVEAIETMKAKYGALVQTRLSDNMEKAAQIQRELKAILQGTGIEAGELLNGSKNINTALEGKSPVAVAGSFGRMTVFMNDPASLWGGQLKNSTKLKQTITDQSAVSVLNQTLQNRMKEAVDKTIAETQGKEGGPELSKMYKAMISSDGALFRPQAKAAEIYAKEKVKEAEDMYNKAISSRIKASQTLGTVPSVPGFNAKTVYDKYYQDFNSVYKQNRDAIESKVTTLAGAFGQPTVGGAEAAAGTSTWQVQSNQPAISDLYAARVAEAIQTSDKGLVLKTASFEEQADPNDRIILKNYIQQYLSNKGKSGADVGFTLKAERTADMQYTESGPVVPSGVMYQLSFTPEGAKKLLGKNYNPSSSYSYNIFYPNTDDPNKLAERDVVSPTDLALKIKGNSLSTPLPGGQLTVTNLGDKYELSGEYKFYNPYIKAYDKRTISDIAPINSMPSKLITQSVNTLNELVNNLNPR